ncbi:MAG: hypothetical protein ACTSR8_11265 [Promethearchaeota archaeon]
MRLILQIPKTDVSKYEAIDSIDEASEVYKTLFQNTVMEGNDPITITPEEEFWGHCSNIQTWAESNYDTRVIDSRLAFPILKKLSKIGDLNAKIILKKEIIDRIRSSYVPVIFYLSQEGFLEFIDNFNKLILEMKEKLVEIMEGLIVLYLKDIQKRDVIQGGEIKLLKKLKKENNVYYLYLIKRLFTNLKCENLFYLMLTDSIVTIDDFDFIKITENKNFTNLAMFILEHTKMVSNEENDLIKDLLDRIKGLSKQKFKAIIENLYLKGNPLLHLYLDCKGYDTYITRNVYYKNLLCSEVEKGILISIEKILASKLFLTEDLTHEKNEIIVNKNRIEKGVIICKNSKNKIEKVLGKKYIKKFTIIESKV